MGNTVTSASRHETLDDALSRPPPHWIGHHRNQPHHHSSSDHHHHHHHNANSKSIASSTHTGALHRTASSGANHHHHHHHHHHSSDTHIVHSRIVLFQQGNELSSHCMLYDSRSPTEKREASHEMSLLGELIFGPMPMRLNEDTTKIHLLTANRQCLITKLFQIKVPAKTVHSLLQASSENTTDSSDALSLHSTLSSSRNSHQGHFICRGSFALGCILTFNAPLAPSSHTDTSALLKKQNDIQRIVFSHFACIELRLANAMHHCYHALQLACTKRMSALTEASSLHKIFQGYAFNMRFPQSALQKNSAVIRALKDLQRFLHSFLLAPRLEHNLWLESCHFPSQQSSLFQTFLNNLKALHHNHIDTLKDVIPKSSNITSSFQRKTPQQDRARVVNHVRAFTTSVLSAVLTHHTSWTSTFAHHLSPPSSHDVPLVQQQSSPEAQCQSSSAHNVPLSIQQLCSFYGANAQHRRKKFTRVIVVGTNTTFVRELLTVLSYVLRCERIVEKEYIIPGGSSSREGHTPTALSASKQHHPTHRTTRASSFSNRSALISAKFASPLQASPLLSSPLATLKGARLMEESDNIASSVDSISSIMERLGKNETPAPHSSTMGIPRVNTGALASSLSTTPLASPSFHNNTIVHTSLGSFSPSPPGRIPFSNRNFLSPSSQNQSSMISPINLIEVSPILPTRVRSKSSSKVVRKLHFDQAPALNVNIAAATTTTDSTTNTTTVPIPHFTHASISNKDPLTSHKDLKRKFGHALFADVCSSYGPSFVLSGLTKEVDFIEEAINDLKLVLKMKHSGDVEPASEAACIVVDTDSFLCNVIVARRKHSKHSHAEPSIRFQEVESSEFLKDTLKQLDLLHQLNMSSDTMCDYFEDRLEELCISSGAMRHLVLERRDQHNEKRHVSPKSSSNPEKSTFSVKKEDIARSLGVKVSDIPLLKSILQAHDADSIVKHISSGKSVKPKRRKSSVKVA